MSDRTARRAAAVLLASASALAIAGFTEKKHPMPTASSTCLLVPENQWRIAVPGDASRRIAKTSGTARREWMLSTRPPARPQAAAISAKAERCRDRAGVSPVT